MEEKKTEQPRKKYYNKRRRYPRYNKPDHKNISKINFKKISIIVPLLNEEESLKPLYNEIRKALKTISSDYELLFVDDGSTDNSLSVIKEIQKADKKVKFFSFRKNYGKAAALQIAFENAQGDAVITMDADLQDDPAEIPNLLKKLEEGYDLVSGWKKKRRDPFIKKHSSKFFNWTTRIFSGIKIHDFNCGLKAYRGEVVKNIKIYGELHRYIPVLAAWQGFKISEIPVKHHSRRYGKTKYGISRFFKGTFDLITVLFTTRYVKRPMHLFGFLGTLFFILGFGINIYLTVEWFIGISLGNRPILFLGILLIIIGVQFFAIGLLGELFVHNSRDNREYQIKEKN